MWVGLRCAITDTTITIPMLVRPTDTTVLAGFPAACLSVPGLGTAGVDAGVAGAAAFVADGVVEGSQAAAVLTVAGALPVAVVSKADADLPTVLPVASTVALSTAVVASTVIVEAEAFTVAVAAVSMVAVVDTAAADTGNR
jgi:hypothetical protein